MGKSVKQSSGKAFISEYLSPVRERQIRGDDETLPLISPTDDFKQEFCSGLRERDISQFVKDEEVVGVSEILCL